MSGYRKKMTARRARKCGLKVPMSVPDVAELGPHKDGWAWMWIDATGHPVVPVDIEVAP